MSHRHLLGATLLFAGISPYFAMYFNIQLVYVFTTVLFMVLFIQETWIIQYIYRRENILFTRRFNQRFPPGTHKAIRFSPLIFSVSLLSLLWLISMPTLTVSAVYLSGLLLFIFIRIFDPLLGCLADYSKSILTSIFAYFVIYIYAVSAAVDRSKIGILPEEFSQSIMLASLSVTILGLRMAYYEKFCFDDDQKIEAQMKLVLVSLLFLSLPNVVNLFYVTASALNG